MTKAYTVHDLGILHAVTHGHDPRDEHFVTLGQITEAQSLGIVFGDTFGDTYDSARKAGAVYHCPWVDDSARMIMEAHQ
jgi:hypothetical protein